MLLRYLELNNFLSHEHTEISFPEQGMFLLSGESGAGKSSFIIDSVVYALYGAKATRARKQIDLLHEEHPGQAMNVRAMFEFNSGERLTIERGFDSKGQSFTKLYEPGDEDNEAVLLAEGAQPVSRKLVKLLGGMSWQQFYAAFVARQSEIADLTTRNPSDRKKLIHQMLGMKELDKGSELISARLRRRKAEEEQLQRSVGSFDLKAARERLEEAAKRIEVAQERHAQSQEELVAKQTQIEELQKQLTPLSASVKAAEQLTGLEAQVRAATTDLEVKTERYQKHLQAQKALEGTSGVSEERVSLVGRRDQLRELYLRSKEFMQNRQKLEEETKRKTEFSQQLDGRFTTAESVRSRQQVLASENKHHQSEIEEKREQLQKLEESGECYVCQRSFDSEHDHQQVLENLQQHLQSIEDKLEANQKELTELEETLPVLEQIESVESNITIVSQRIEEINAQGDINEDLEAVAAEGKCAAERVEELDQKIATIEADKRDLSENAEGERQQAETGLQEAEEALKQAQMASADEEKQTEYERLHKEELQSQEQLTALKAKLPELQRAIDSAQREHQGLERELKGREKELQDLEKMRQDVLLAERVSTYLRAYQRKLAEEIRPALQEIGSEMLNRISNGRHVAMHINDDYDITIETSQGASLKASMLSGGEEIRTNICLRLALTRLVSQRTGVPVGFLIFDEPLPAQDPGHIERILELLDSLRPFYQQQFIISHVGDLRAADEMNYILEFQRATGTQPAVQLVNA